MDDQGGSNVNPLALLFLAVMCLVTIGSSRKNALRAVLATAAFVPLGQQIVIAGLHLHFLRILILVGFYRLISRREIADFKLEKVDKLFIGWVVVGFICGLVREPSAETFGAVYNELGTYFLVRILMKHKEDALNDLKILAFLGVAIGLCMAVENITHRDAFYVFGGVPQVPMQRGDRFRCQGPFRQPILAGTFGASLFPLMVGLWYQNRRGRWLAVLGGIGAIVITIASASSGPLLTFIAAVIGFALWPLRERMHLFRRSLVGIFVGFALVMNAPVWYLIAKVSDLVGGGGWHRAYLIDQFVSHFREWWMIGTSYTAHWAPAGEVLTVNPKMMDITNHYVAQGVQGGILELGLFIAVLVACFKIIGRSVRDKNEFAVDRKFYWAFGVSLASHCVAFISVSYFDQIQVFWFWLLAVIATIPAWRTQEVESREQELAAEETDDSFATTPAASN